MKVTLSIVLFVIVSACARDDAGGIVDIGKACSAARDCEHVCVHEAGMPAGQCSLACETERDCPSFMDCITSSSTNARRCFNAGGLVSPTLAVQCTHACGDLDYFCSTDEVTDADEAACTAWCADAADAERQQLVDCVRDGDRYESACPAVACLDLVR